MVNRLLPFSTTEPPVPEKLPVLRLALLLVVRVLVGLPVFCT